MEELKKSKKIKEPILTAEEKASKVNKATIKGTGTLFYLFISNIVKASIWRWSALKRART